MHTFNFNLKRYFSLLTLILIALAGMALSELVRRHETGNLMQMAESRNVAMTRIFQNALWPDFASLAAAHAPPSADRQQELRRKVVALMNGSDTIKVKVYNTEGITVFSTDPSQVGEDKHGNAGFMTARAGRVASELTHRDQIDAFEGTREGRDVMSSYVPVLVDGRLSGVIESYQDVTPFVAKVREERTTAALVVFCVLGILYFSQLLVVHRAHLTISEQAQALEAANAELDRRVEARTRELAEANRHLELEVAEHRQTQGQLDYLSYYDALTRLPNRNLLMNRLTKTLSTSDESGWHGAALLVDLDHFRTINDTEGRARGDELLVQVAQRLLHCVRERDTVARLGNDQFLVMAEDLGRTRGEAATMAEALATQIGERLLLPLPDEGRAISGSIGIALFGERGHDADGVVKEAELAMHEAKSAGRGLCRFFDPDMQAAVSARAALERDLRHAIETSQFELHYQPQLNHDRRVLGAEALVRWHHPERGMVPPVEFIPFAEESGLILPLGQWILHAACRQLAAWSQQPDPGAFALAVNVSAVQFRQPDFVDSVLDTLAATGAPPARLKLEITESLLLNDFDDIVAKMRVLRARGIGFALDDFGTGYSSLSYLATLPIDQLKIDRSFVHALETRSDSALLCATIIGLAHNLKLGIVAEGVETEAQAYFLSTVHHCDLMQGYHFARPLALPAFDAFVRSA